MESGFRSTDWQQLTFAVVGMGLIGGSYAKALRRLGVKKIIGVDTDGKVLRQAQEQAVIDEALCGAGPGLQAADVVICSVYPASTLDFVKSAVPFLKSDVLITDATGIKGSLPEDVQRLLTGRMEFIAGHPMAGVKAAVWVCPRPRFLTVPIISWCRQLLTAVGRSNG